MERTAAVHAVTVALDTIAARVLCPASAWAAGWSAAAAHCPCVDGHPRPLDLTRVGFPSRPHVESSISGAEMLKLPLLPPSQHAGEVGRRRGRGQEDESKKASRCGKPVSRPKKPTRDRFPDGDGYHASTHSLATAAPRAPDSARTSMLTPDRPARARWLR